VCETTVVQDAWMRGQPLTVHGLIYALHDGYLRDLMFHVSQQSNLEQAYQKALVRVNEVSRTSV
jgi:carbonic anhydrase